MTEHTTNTEVQDDHMTALEQIAQRIDDAENNTTEITTEEYDALNLGDRRPLARGRSNTTSVSYALYDVDDGHNHGWRLAVKTTHNNQGDKRTRHYATGIGEVSFNAAGLDRETLREELEEVGAGCETVDELEAVGHGTVTDEELDTIEQDYEWGEEETIDVLIHEDAVVMEKHTLYTSVTDTDALLLEPLKRADVEYPDEAPIKQAMRAAQNASMPSNVEMATVDVQVEMEFSYPGIDQ